MTATGPDRLYALLPALLRQRDIDEGRPLQTLLRAITEQADIVRQNVDRLWDDVFIETCQDWVIPYIGDLVANRLLHDVDGRRRVDVARTVYYRRRKGTLPMLEELARDVTGWGVHAVEFFELLGWTQHLDHLRFQAGMPDIRDIDRMDRIDGPFDEVSHTVDVRPPSTDEGWHNIRTIGFFLYRLRSFPLQGTVLTDTAGVEYAVRPEPRVAGAAHLFHVSSLGAPAPLFNRWRPEGDEAGLATELFVPGPIRPLAVLRDLERRSETPTTTLDHYYGAAGLLGAGLDECDISTPAVSAGGSLAVFADGVVVPPELILCKDLSTWQGPAAGSETVAVDVRLGRLAFAPDAVPASVTVEYHYGLAGAIGGGPYDRRRRVPTDPRFRGWGPDTVADPHGFGPEPLAVAAATADHDTITAALAEWRSGPPPRPPVVIQVEDDRTYVESLTISIDGASRIVVQAANERRPTVIGTITVEGDNPDARVALDGLVIEGHVAVTGELGELRLSHCTIVPGRALDGDGRPTCPTDPAVEVATPNPALRLIVDSCIVGPVRTPAEMAGIIVSRSIIDGVGTSALARTGTDDEAAGPADLHNTTVLGAVHTRTLEMASDVIFTAAVTVERTQAGCVRFSYVPPGSVTPRRYRCQPDLALAADDLDEDAGDRIRARLRPAFTSTRFHDPAYAQLGPACPVEIATGAEDGSEMGVWSWLRNPQREANLRLRLDEYLPFGLDPALIRVT